MRKSVTQMSEEEYAEHMRLLNRRILFWGLMYTMHPIPLLVLIFIVWGIASCFGVK